MLVMASVMVPLPVVALVVFTAHPWSPWITARVRVDTAKVKATETDTRSQDG